MLSQQLRAKRKTAVLFLAAGAIAGMQAAPLANAQALSAQYVPIMQSFAGNGTAGYLGDTGAATAAELSAPWGVAYDASGNLYIADNKNNVIRKVAVGTGTITTVAGGGSSPTTCSGTTDSVGDGCLATSATLNDPEQVAFDPAGLREAIPSASPQRPHRLTVRVPCRSIVPETSSLRTRVRTAFLRSLLQAPV